MGDNQVQYLFADVGDTLLRHGQLLPEVLTALYQLAQHNVEVVPVTGASAGAGEAMIRQWPIRMIIAESGAVAFSKQNGEVSRHTWLPETQLAAMQQQVLTAITPHLGSLALADDQVFRLSDVAVNLAQDNVQAGESALAALQQVVSEHGWQSGLSSIHYNIWQPPYNKALAIVHWMQTLWGVDENALALHSACIGDSPNDAEMFARIPRSFGVNGWQVRQAEFSDEPAITLGNGSGWGFVELAHKLLATDYWDEE